MLSTVNPTFRYQVLLEMCIFDITRKHWILNKCEDCSGFENVVDFRGNEICKKWSIDDAVLSSGKRWSVRANGWWIACWLVFRSSCGKT